MGGTTAKAALLENYQPMVTTEYEIGASVTAGRRLRGSGYPVKMPVVDLVEIGAGGGSVAWLDAAGGLRVGPSSMGASPGPSCYGKGGNKPTITDAYLTMGVIDPDYFLGGDVKIYPKLAEKAIREQIAEPLHVDVVQASGMIAEIANVNMARMLRIATVQRGRDPREFDLVAFGGAGPLVAGRLMEELEFRRVIVPWGPGLFTAYGLIVANVGRDYVKTKILKLGAMDLDTLNNTFKDLETRAVEDLTEESISRSRIVLERSVDMRYIGQSFELNIPFPNGEVGKSVIKKLEDLFVKKHEVVYGHSVVGEPMEIVNIRVSATGLVTSPEVRKLPKPSDGVERALKGRQPVYFRSIDKSLDSPIYLRSKLLPTDVLEGPAIIQQPDATTVVYPGQIAEVDEYGLLSVSVAWGQRHQAESHGAKN